MAPIEFESVDKLEYQFFPAGRDGVVFRVRCTNDAHLALTSGPEESDPMLEVFIGGWKNSKSVIRKNRTKPDVAEVDTPDIVSGEEFRGFWIRWTDNIITVGKEGEAAAFLSYENTAEPFPINFVGTCTGWGASGSWILEAPSEAPPAWVQAANGDIPDGALQGGTDCNGEPLYVARGHHEGALLPGKLACSHGVCFVPWGGQEHPIGEYEVLVGRGNWVKTSGDQIPPNAIPGGESEDGEPLFIGRAHHEGSVTTGKVQPSHSACYISFAGQELAFTDYEVLTC